MIQITIFYFRIITNCQKTIDLKQLSSLSFSTVSLLLEPIENSILCACSDVYSLVVDINIYQQDQLLSLEKMLIFNLWIREYSQLFLF